MTTFYSFTCNTPNADLHAVVQHGLDYTRARLGGRNPVAVHMHPDNIRRYTATHGDWPPDWPKLIENRPLGRDHIGIEPGADNPHAPQQLRLI